MKNPKKRVDQEKTAEEKALEFKNFEKLKDSYTTSKLPKEKLNYWNYLTGAVAIGAVISIFYFTNNVVETEEVIMNSEITEESNRPYPNISVEYEEFMINPNEQTEIKSEDGSIIIIPANSIVNSEGKLVSSEVELKYREFRDMIDVFLSGITMEYDSAGSSYHFESAGMFELLAYQKDGPVFINPKKSITVKFASTHKGDHYNIYNFNKKEQQWEFMYKDTANTANIRGDSDMLGQIEMIGNEINRLEEGMISEPILATPKQINIQLDVLEEEFPEIAVYTNIRFQIVNQENFEPSLAELEWDIVNVLKTEEEEYLLHFERGKEVKEFLCIPVFEQDDYVNAKELFKEKYKNSLELLKQKKNDRIELVKQYKSEKKSQQDALVAYKVRKEFNSDVAASLGIITRIFSIKSFGIYNSDCPQKLPKGALLALKLRNAIELDGEKYLEFGKTYLVEKGKNALYTYNSLNEFSYNPSSENLVWTITKDNKLAIFSYDDFEQISTAGKGEEYSFKMKVIDDKINNEAQFRKYFEI